MRWLAALQEGRFDGERKELLGSELLDEAPGELRAYLCPCCGRCATPLPGSAAQAELDAVQAEWVPYVLIHVSASARVGIYGPPPEFREPTPDLLTAMVPA